MSIDTSKVATTNTTAATASGPNRIGAVAEWADDRLGLATMAKKNLRKVFPDHWSFMLGEIALWSFVVLLLSGVFLTLWFNPSMGETTYEGSYAQLRGLRNKLRAGSWSVMARRGGVRRASLVSRPLAYCGGADGSTTGMYISRAQSS